MAADNEGGASVNGHGQLTVTVDLEEWRTDTVVRIVADPGVSIGHLTDELVVFLGLPDPERLGMSLPYALADSSGHHLDDGEEVAGLDAEDVYGLGIDWSDLPAIARNEIERRLTDLVRSEIESWLATQEELVLAHVEEAKRRIRRQIMARADEMIPAGWRGAVARFRNHRALRRLTGAGHLAAYEPAARAGLGLASSSAGPLSSALLGAGSGGVGGGTLGAVAGATVAVVTVLLLDTLGGPPDGVVHWFTGRGGPAASTVAADTGDLYLDLDTGDQFLRGDGAWESEPLPARRGERGEPGPPGPPGIDGAAGEAGPGRSGARSGTWTIGVVEPPAAESEAGQLFFNRCSGVLSQFDGGDPTAGDGDEGQGDDEEIEGTWRPVAAMPGTGGLGTPEDCPGLRTVGAGGSLWDVIAANCPEARTNRERAAAVSATWAASLNLSGSDADDIEPDTPIILRCR
ncbi:MAG: hypothetical protein AAFN30_20325 [Actinomycetota bacterium]